MYLDVDGKLYHLTALSFKWLKIWCVFYYRKDRLLRRPENPKGAIRAWMLSHEQRITHVWRLCCDSTGVRWLKSFWCLPATGVLFPAKRAITRHTDYGKHTLVTWSCLTTRTCLLRQLKTWRLNSSCVVFDLCAAGVDETADTHVRVDSAHFALTKTLQNVFPCVRFLTAIDGNLHFTCTRRKNNQNISKV